MVKREIWKVDLLGIPLFNHSDFVYTTYKGATFSLKVLISKEKRIKQEYIT